MNAHSRRLVSSIAIALVLVTDAARASECGGTWEDHAPMLLARQEVGAARIGDFVYVVGGLRPGFVATATAEVYDIVQDSWSSIASMPVALDHMGVAAHGGLLYVFGGYSGDFDARDETWIYDPQTDMWAAGAPLPNARGAPWAVTHRDLMYVIGGSNSADQARPSNYIYDPVLDSWTVGAQMSVAREHLTAAVHGDFLYVIGGRAGGSTSANERYEPATNTWTTMAPMPTARSAMGTATFGGHIYVMGGEVPVLFSVNEVYDVATNSWATSTPMQLARHGVAAVTLDDRILFPAGGIIQGLLPTAAVDSFVPAVCPEPFCFCDSGSVCGNVDAGAGCANATGVGGLLATSGTVSVTADDLVLTATQLPINNSGRAFMGPVQINTLLGNGQRCVGGGMTGTFRYPIHDSGGAGVITEGPGIVAFSTGFGAGAIAAGSTWNFQVWYRDGMGPCGETSNLTNAVAVTFVP